jgi:hypothetical protein
MIFNLEGVDIEITVEANGIRLKTDFQNVLILGQRWADLKPIFLNNYRLVKGAFVENQNIISEIDFTKLIIKIVIQYLGLYAMWRVNYEKEKDRDLTFCLEDLKSPMTYDCVTDYLQLKYRKDFRQRAARILNMTDAEYLAHETARKRHMDK